MPEPPQQDPLADAITIEFVAQLATTKKPSTAQSSRAPKPKEEKPQQVKPKPKPVDSPQPKPQPKPKPTITIEEPSEVEMPDAHEPAEEVEPVPENAEPESIPQEPEEDAGSPNNSSSSPEVDNGTNGSGHADGNAGMDDEDYSGDGVFGRRVTYRPDIKELTERNGVIIVGVCVNPDGKVVKSEFIEEGSTITDRNLIAKATFYAKYYRFDKDYTAPRKQCGKLTFIFKIEN
ncbi:MAG: hypothetical protein AAFV80_17990 [Bacteroidota bacterium]